MGTLLDVKYLQPKEARPENNLWCLFCVGRTVNTFFDFSHFIVYCMEETKNNKYKKMSGVNDVHYDL